MRIIFRVNGKPQGKGRHRTAVTKSGRVHAYTPKNTVNYEKSIAQYFKKEVLTKRIAWPTDAVYSLMVSAYFGVPKSWTKARKARAYAGEIFPTVVPDGDNILKVVGDGLNKLAWRDDKQVVFQVVQKRYCAEHEEPHILVEVAILEQ